ncbi:hypothetical protein ILUMI_16386 [Ignelater luminosus]|uniref:DDE-1 domain-containing protein n=1 Tax=Ignelater luminosus TaxID=2038154 RepID=A0A8K0CR57_IGNLU|nr:hypothetical protein ILUMI_16386 [Ignelater luminosus]
MDEFCDNLEEVYDDNGFTANRRFNVDERGLTIGFSCYMSEFLMKGAPAGLFGKAHPFGWIQTHFKYFVYYVKPTEASSVLLLLDGHLSYTKNIELVELARKTTCNIVTPTALQKIRMWLRQNNRPLTAYDIAELRGNAYGKYQTGNTAAKGFSVGGLYPFNRHIFTKEDYLATADESSCDISKLVETL